MKNLIISAFAIILVMLTSCKDKGKKSSGKEKMIPGVEVIVAAVQEFNNTVEVNGTVLSNEMVELHPEVSGRLTYLNLPDGERVKEGETLARVNDAELQAGLEQQKNQLELARKTEQRLKSLLLVNGVTQAEYDAALAQLISLQAGVNMTHAQIDKTIVRAPFSGTLGLRQVSPGAYVSPQTILSTLQQTELLKIDFTVPEPYYELVSKGKTVMIKQEKDSVMQQAVILAVEPQVNSSTRNLKVRALVKNTSLLPGGFVKVYLVEKQSGILIPTNAIIPESVSNQVIVIQKGKAVFKNVQTGERSADQVEIEKGLSAGDTIVVSGVLFVRPDAAVRIKKVRTLTERK